MTRTASSTVPEALDGVLEAHRAGGLRHLVGERVADENEQVDPLAAA